MSQVRYNNYEGNEICMLVWATEFAFTKWVMFVIKLSDSDKMKWFDYNIKNKCEIHRYDACYLIGYIMYDFYILVLEKNVKFIAMMHVILLATLCMIFIYISCGEKLILWVYNRC